MAWTKLRSCSSKLSASSGRASGHRHEDAVLILEERERLQPDRAFRPVDGGVVEFATETLAFRDVVRQIARPGSLEVDDRPIVETDEGKRRVFDIENGARARCSKLR